MIHDLTRRQALQLMSLPLLGAPLHDCLQLDAAPADISKIRPLNRFPRMVQEYFVARVRKIERASSKARAALQTRNDARKYVELVQAKIQRSFGPFPEKTPLKPRVTGKVERETYTIEKLIFESRPGFLVTGNLYVPKGKKFPVPGVVGTCGHSTTGKAADAYQAFSQGLARMGYVVLIYDPIGQGERLQYVKSNFKVRPGVGEHLYAGNQQFLVGDFLGTWRAWDGIRALDYLQTRKEVDPKRIGVTGNSGGGTMTTWLCGVEQRWSMAAPSCFVTTFRRNLENELPADTEQCPPNALALGLDHADFLAALAPKPIIILAKEKDYFDVRGSIEAYERLKRLYKLLGAEENIKLFIGPTTHGYSQENREAMYQWFNGVTRISDAKKEPELVIEKGETLQCTPKGQVADLGSRTVFSFTQAKAKQLARQRKKRTGDQLKSEVARSIQGLAVQPRKADSPEYRILRELASRGYPLPRATSYAVETEPGIHAIVYRLGKERLMSRPSRGNARAVLYVSHQSSDAELREEPLVRDLIKQESKAVFYACDVRGIGESQPDTCGLGKFLLPYGSDYFYAIHSLMLGSPYVGQKTGDVLQVLEWLKAHGHTEVHLAGKGWGALPAAFAGLLAETVVQVTLKNALTSYQDIAESEEYDWPLSALLPGVLKRFDLPEVYEEIRRDRKLALHDSWGARSS